MATTAKNSKKLSMALLLASTIAGALVLIPANILVMTAYAHEGLPTIEEGKMTGGGRINAPFVLSHGFELHCVPNDGPNNLEINWNGGNRFHLESVTDINCFDDATQSPNPPSAPFDVLELSGFGRFNGESGAFVWVQLTDYGEPGKNDWATVVVYDADGNLVLDQTGNLQVGNHQAHKG